MKKIVELTSRIENFDEIHLRSNTRLSFPHIQRNFLKLSSNSIKLIHNYSKFHHFYSAYWNLVSNCFNPYFSSFVLVYTKFSEYIVLICDLALCLNHYTRGIVLFFRSTRNCLGTKYTHILSLVRRKIVFF